MSFQREDAGCRMSFNFQLRNIRENTISCFFFSELELRTSIIILYQIFNRIGIVRTNFVTNIINIVEARYLWTLKTDFWVLFAKVWVDFRNNSSFQYFDPKYMFDVNLKVEGYPLELGTEINTFSKIYVFGVIMDIFYENSQFILNTISLLRLLQYLCQKVQWSWLFLRMSHGNTGSNSSRLSESAISWSLQTCHRSSKWTNIAVQTVYRVCNLSNSEAD